MRRKPALMAVIRKFNTYCKKLKDLAGDLPNFPLPQPLSTNLDRLRGSDDLMQDVWINTAIAESPLWLTNEKVRKGIRAMLMLDHCVEELRRLGREADNLLRVFKEELTVHNIALVKYAGTTSYIGRIYYDSFLDATSPRRSNSTAFNFKQNILIYLFFNSVVHTS